MHRCHSLLLATLLMTSACGDDNGGAHLANPYTQEAGAVIAGEAGVPGLGMMGALGGGATAGAALEAGAGGPIALADGGVPTEAGARDGGPLQSGTCANGEPLAANLKLRELSLYQAVKIPLFKDGAWVATRNATVVQGKKALVRAFVDPQAGYAPHALRAVLTLDNGGTKTVLMADRTIMAASSDEAADSTFDFPIEGELISGATQLSVAVIEPSCPAQAPVNGAAARVPASGLQALNATSIGDLHVVLVPVTLGTSTPDVGAEQLTKYKEALRAYYPVADVDVTAHAPISWTGAIRADGSGWSELLNQIGRQRQSDGVAGNVYYFGLITPTPTFRDYCKTGCVLGLAPQTTYISRPNQIGLGVGFIDDNSYTTLVHELGHAHGLPHAPCAPRGGSIQGADTKFPYPGGKIGSWGWDSRSSKLMAPATYADVMSYCDPIWISDYNYEKIATRCKAVNTAASIFFAKGAETEGWNGILLLQSGSARWSGVTLDAAPNDTISARALDASGRVVGEVEVARVALSHTPDEFLYVPDLDPSWASLDLGDRVLRIADILPATP